MNADPSPSPGAAAAPGPVLQAPPLRRRLACFLYEGVLLFGVVMIAGLVYSVATGQRHALQGLHGMQAFVFVVLGLYFTWFWTLGGQTLAMQTWHIRLVSTTGRRVSKPRALLRYLLSWLWFLPALAAAHFAGLHGTGPTFGLLAAGVAVYAGLSFLHPQRQYWHDAVCGTRLVHWRPAPRA